MTDDRKRRTDSWDASLTEAQQAQVFDRMRRFSWYAVSKWIAEEFHIDAPSRAGLYRFRDWFTWQHLKSQTTINFLNVQTKLSPKTSTIFIISIIHLVTAGTEKVYLSPKIWKAKKG